MYMTRSSTKRTADMAEQPTVPSHLEDAEEGLPLVSLSKLMDVMTKRLERLLAEQDKRSKKVFTEFFDERLQRLDRQEAAVTDSDVTAVDSVVTVTSISVPVKRAKNATRAKKSAKQVKKSAKRPKPSGRRVRRERSTQRRVQSDQRVRRERSVRSERSDRSSTVGRRG